MISKVRVVILLVLFGATWWGLQVTSDVAPVPIKKSLGLFPRTIGEYTLSDSFQSSAGVVEMLGVSDYIQYTYLRDDGYPVNLYVGYYEVVGMGAGYHSPKNCIPGGGWGIDTVKSRQLDAGIENEQSSSVSEMLIRRGNDYQIVYYWYQNRGRIISSEYWEKIYQVVDALFTGRRDGSFVRIIASAPNGDLDLARSVVKDFSEQVVNQLEEYLPGAKL